MEPGSFWLSRLTGLPLDVTPDHFCATEVKKNKVFCSTQEDDKTNTLQLFAGENLRRGMLTRGIKFNDKLAKSFLAGEGMGDCGSDGSCGLCTVTVTEGAELLSEAEDSEKEILQESSPEKRLSCRAIVGYGMREGVIKL